MRDYDAIYDDATDDTPFSNGTSGEIWMGSWCYRCKVDAPFNRGETDQGCPLLLVALMQRTPKEWTKVGLQDYHCSEFRPDDEGDGDDPLPPPVPVCDGQTDMFEAFADQIVEQVTTELAVAR